MRLLLVTISILLSVFCAEAQTEKPIRWVFSLSKNEVKQGEVVEIIMKAEISPDWYLYSSDFDPNLGPTVSSVSFVTNGSFKSMGDLKPIGAKEKYDSLWEGKVRYFVKHAEFRQKVKILNVNPLIKATLMYQVCSDREGKCIPYEENLVFDKLKVIAGEITPEKQGGTEQSNATNTAKETEVKKPVYKDKLSELEAEKNKLVEKDSNGNDIAIEQLKTFTQKYGGDK